MSESEVRVVQLEPIRFASAWAFGPGPEEMAWSLLQAWAEPKGFLADPEKHRIFGFNNPNPSSGSPNYGYEFWITVDPDVEPEGEIRVGDFHGGLYAVMGCGVGSGDLGQVIPAAWKRLDAWVGDSKYRPGRHQWLEEHTLQGELLDLYYPISE